MNSAGLYFRYIGASVRSQMQYRASFLMQSFGQFLVCAIEFLGVWALFNHFGTLKGWKLPEVALLYGMINISLSISDAASRGFDIFGSMVRAGNFDRLLLRPRSTVLQLAGQELTLRRVGRLIQALVVLLWASSALHLAWTPAKATLMIAAILGGACLFYGFVVFQATVAFWTVESLELFNIFTYGGVETAQYPITVYRPWFRRIFTYIIPLAAANYFPAHALLGRADILGSSVLFQWASPLLGLAFLILSLQVWRIGVRHYCSTGS